MDKKSAALKNRIPATPLGKFDNNDEDEAPQTPVGVSTPVANVRTPVGSTPALDRSQLSPMHPARPTVRHHEEEETEGSEKIEGATNLVDAIFSPMLKLLGGEDGEDDEVERPELEPVAENDHDVSHLEEEERSESNNDEEADIPQEDAVIVETDECSSQGSEEIEDEEEFNPYAFIKSLPDYEDVKGLCPADRLPAKDEDAPPITLVLDLDETLVHCTVEQVDDADLTFPVDFHGMTYQVNVRLRPYLDRFLKAIANKFEVVVFTASQQVYADALLDLIDPKHEYIKYRMFRESCLPVEGNYLKDLNVLGRDLKKSVLVDNSPHAFGYQVDNGIPIESWFDDKNDTELLKLERFLRTLHQVEDVRSVVRRTFRTYELIQNAP